MSFDKAPVIICVGSDLVVGDSLGPLIGTMIRKNNIDAFVYGTLENPITANEIPRLNERVRSAHPKSPVLVIDAAVGTAELCPGALVRAEMAVFRRITHIAGAFSAMGADLDFSLQNKCDSQK